MWHVTPPEKHTQRHPSVDRVADALRAHGHHDGITWLSESARTAREAAQALDIEVGQIASSLVFTRPSTQVSIQGDTPVLVVTSGRHRVDTALVAQALTLDALGRADAAFVRKWSGFAIGGVAPVGWSPAAEVGAAAQSSVTVVVDIALADYETVWAAAGHPHAVFPTAFASLLKMTNGIPMRVGD